MNAGLDLGLPVMARLPDVGSSGAVSEATRLAERFHLGGFVFRTLVKFRSPNEVAVLLAQLSGASGNLSFLALEPGSGPVHALRRFLPDLPSSNAVARHGTEGWRAAERLGELIGQACRLLGFNTNLAPSLDLARSSSDRQSFGSEPRQVARCAEAWLRGIKRHGILACGRDFPGAPDSSDASNAEKIGKLPVISRTMAQLWREDVAPYRELANDLPMVKIGVAACKAYDPQILRPVTLSAGVVEGLLRTKLQYDGVAVADISETAAAADNATVGEVAAQSLAAGCDLLIVEGRGHVIETVTDEIARAIESGALSAERMAQARRRLHRATKHLARPGGKVAARPWERLRRDVEAFREQCERAPSGEVRIA